MPSDREITPVWQEHRPYLIDLAFRMLGNIHDAEDVVQEAFSRLLRQDLDAIEDVRGWLIVVVSRACLDQLRSARSRRESGEAPDDRVPTPEPGPADRVTLDDSIRMALLVVLRELTPPERAVFVLHDVFQFTFETVASVVGRTPAACRQLASRARRRIESQTGPARFSIDTADHHLVAERFIAACSGGSLDALMALLDPDVAGDVDLGEGTAPRRPQRGRRVVARGLMGFMGPRTGVTLVSHSVNGHPAVLAFLDGHLGGLLQLKTRNGLIYDIHAIRDPAKLAFVSGQLAP